MGKYWELEEITAEEATAIIGKREEEMAPKEETQEPEKRPQMGALLRRRQLALTSDTPGKPSYGLFGTCSSLAPQEEQNAASPDALTPQ